MENFKEKHLYYKTPWNILEVFYIIENDNKFFIKDELDIRKWTEPTKFFNSIEEARNAIRLEKQEQARMWYILTEEPEDITENNILEIISKIDSKKEEEIWEISKNILDEYIYYSYSHYDIDKKDLYVTHYFIFNQYNEYVWKFIITRFIEEDHSAFVPGISQENLSKEKYSYTFGSIFISKNFQRQWVMTKIINNELLPLIMNETSNIDEDIENDIEGVYVFGIFDEAIWFYKKLEEQDLFEFFPDKHSWFLTLS